VLNDPVNRADPCGYGTVANAGAAIAGPGQTFLKNAAFEIGSNDGAFMLRWGTRVLGGEAYRGQVRLFENLIHVASNREYGGGLKGLHLAVNTNHYYSDRMVVQDFSVAPEIRQHFATKLPYFSPAMAEKPYPELIRKAMKLALPCIKYGGKFLNYAGWAWMLYDVAQYVDANFTPRYADDPESRYAQFGTVK